MSRRNIAETLKGGVLLMGILMILLLVFGGILKFVIGDKPDGPVYKVEVKFAPPADRQAQATQQGGDSLFQIPPGAIDVAPAQRMKPEDLAARTDIDWKRFIDAGLRMAECRRFAMTEATGDAVSVCARVMESAAGALAAHSAARPYPDTFDMPGIDRGYITPDGFNVVRGSACFEIRRANAGDNCRQLAMSFISGLDGQDFGPDAGELLDALPAQDRVAGSERILAADLAAADGRTPMVRADYMADGVAVAGGVVKTESVVAARGMADAAAAELARRGAVRKTVAGAPSGTFFFLDGQFPVAVGSSGDSFFRIEGRGGITAVARLASIFARKAERTDGPRSETP